MQSIARIRFTTALLFLTGLSGSIASAHPGHGPVSEVPGPMHYLLSPTHWGVVALVIVSAAAVVMLRRCQVRTFFSASK